MHRQIALVAASVLTAPALLVLASTSAVAGGVTCHGHRATIVGTTHKDVLHGTPGDDVIVGLAGRDTIDGGGGDDIICGGRDGGGFTTTLDGGAGADILDQDSSGSIVGGSGDDSVWTDVSDAPFTAGQTIDGGDGTDLLMLSDLAGRYDHLAFDLASGLLDADGTDVAATGFENFETRGDISGDTTSYDVTGTDGANRFYVQQTNESVVIHAAGGDDVITGGNGDDTLDGGPGDDTANAGDGTDTCVSVEHATGCESVSP